MTDPSPITHLASDAQDELTLERTGDIFDLVIDSKGGDRGSGNRASVEGLSEAKVRTAAHRLLSALTDPERLGNRTQIARWGPLDGAPDVELSFVEIPGEPEVQLHITGAPPIPFPDRAELARALAAIAGLARLNIDPPPAWLTSRPAAEWVTRAAYSEMVDRKEALLGQIDHLGAAIAALGIHEPTQDEDPVACAIRLLRAAYVDGGENETSPRPVDGLPGVASPYLVGARLGRAGDFLDGDWECRAHESDGRWIPARHWDGGVLVQARQPELEVSIPRQLAADLDVGNIDVEGASDVLLAAIKAAFATGAAT